MCLFLPLAQIGSLTQVLVLQPNEARGSGVVLLLPLVTQYVERLRGAGASGGLMPTTNYSLPAGAALHFFSLPGQCSFITCNILM